MNAEAKRQGRTFVGELPSRSGYHDDPCETPSLSRSVLVELLHKSPRHAWQMHPRLNPDYRAVEDSRFDLGAAAHDLLMHGDGRVTVVPADDWRTKAARAARDEARKEGNVPILEKHRAPLMAMIESCRSCLEHSEFKGLLRAAGNTKKEVPIVWRESGILCRCMPDLLGDDPLLCLDYKTTECAEPGRWARCHMAACGYDVQAEFYSRAVEAAAGVRPFFAFAVQEIHPPYSTSFVSLANAAWEVAAAKVDRGLEIWGECLQTNNWPAYPTRVCYHEPAPWEVDAAFGWRGNDAI